MSATLEQYFGKLIGKHKSSLRVLLLAEAPSWNWSHTRTAAAAGSTPPVVVRSNELSGDDGDSSVDAEDDENLCFLIGFNFGDGVDNCDSVCEERLCASVSLAVAATVAASSKAAITVFRDILALVSTYIEAPAFCANASAWSGVTDVPAAPILSLLKRYSMIGIN